MAISLYTVTGNASDILGSNFDPRRVKVVVSTNLPRGEAPIDLENNRVLLGSSVVWPNADGSFTIPNLIGHDSEDVNPTGIQYKIDVVYVDAATSRNDSPWTTGWVSITEDAAISDLVAEQYVPPAYQSAFMADAEELRDETRTYRDQARDISNIEVPEDVMQTVDANPASTFRQQQDARLLASFVGIGGDGPASMDPDTAVRPYPLFVQNVVDVASTGDVTVTLGAPALNDQVSLCVKRGSAAPARLWPTSYTVDGASVFIPTLVAGDKILVEYDCDGDQFPEPADAVIDGYLVFDNFERADSASSMGNATSGQTWAPKLSSVWGISAGEAYKVTNGTAAGVNDCTLLDAGASDVTVDVVVRAIVAGGWIGPVGRALDSTSLFRVGAGGLLRRSAGAFTTLSTLSRQPVVDDTVRLRMVEDELSVLIKHGSGDFELVAGPVTDTFQQTSTLHGLILSGSTATYGGARAGFFGVKAAS